MLIINADDWGGNRLATNRSLFCYKKGRITSASAMMFMEDSDRSAALALGSGLDVGLHLNFTLGFSAPRKPAKLGEFQNAIAAFLLRNKYCCLLYHPLLKRQFDYVYEAQYEEYMRLYNRVPTHIDGHDHMHLCMNMIVDKIIPKGLKVRRNFSFTRNEKGPFNRFYRQRIDRWLARRYICTDFFFGISPLRSGRLQRIVHLGIISNVELMVHAQRSDEYEYLMSEEYAQAISDIEKGSYVLL